MYTQIVPFPNKKASKQNYLFRMKTKEKLVVNLSYLPIKIIGKLTPLL